MTTPRDRVTHLDLLARLESSFTDLPDTPTPDLIDHERFTAYVKTPHDVGESPMRRSNSRISNTKCGTWRNGYSCAPKEWNH
jgi:hypothetical protein